VKPQLAKPSRAEPSRGNTTSEDSELGRFCLRFFEANIVDDMSHHLTVGFFLGAGAWEKDSVILFQNHALTLTEGVYLYHF
jgi:hypothetical protein